MLRRDAGEGQGAYGAAVQPPLLADQGAAPVGCIREDCDKSSTKQDCIAEKWSQHGHRTSVSCMAHQKVASDTFQWWGTARAPAGGRSAMAR